MSKYWKIAKARNNNVKGINAGSGTLFSAPSGRPHVAFNKYNLTGLYNKSSVARCRLTITGKLVRL